jgi:hypothetical protein
MKLIASPIPPKTLVLRDVAAYLGLGSPQAADRWLKAHQVPSVLDRLGYRRVFVREIDRALARLEAEAIEAPRRLSEAG